MGKEQQEEQEVKIEYYKVIDYSEKEVGAFEFNHQDVSLAQRIEILELLRANQYRVVTISKQEYDKITKKFAI